MKKISDIHEQDNKSDTSKIWLKEYFKKAIELSEKGISYSSDEAQELAKDWWCNIKRYTNGDKKLIDQLYQFYNTADNWPGEFSEMQKRSQEFMEKSIEHYLVKNNLYESVK